MSKILLEIPDESLVALKLSPEDMSQELRVAAAV